MHARRNINNTVNAGNMKDFCLACSLVQLSARGQLEVRGGAGGQIWGGGESKGLGGHCCTQWANRRRTVVDLGYGSEEHYERRQVDFF